MQIIHKLTKWVFFNILIALLPVFLNLLGLLTRGKAPSISLLFSHGELLLLSSAISAAAIGELIASSRNYIVLKLISAGSNLIILYLSAYWYADIVNIYNSSTLSASPDVIASGSIIMFTFTIITSGSCIILAEIQ
jgi:hypothetical protein